MFHPTKLKYRYSMDASKEIITLTMTKGSLLKCFAPTLILLGISAGLTAFAAFGEKQDDKTNPFDMTDTEI